MNENTKQAVELLRNASKELINSGCAGWSRKIDEAVLLLEPPPASKHQRIAFQLDLLGAYMGGLAQVYVRNIANIIREEK